MAVFGYEIDYMPVGTGDKSGDAIAIRFGNLFGSRNEQTVIIVDGGTKESGQALVKHLDTHYKTNRADSVILTHGDSDHSSGLTEVLENCEVGELIMHLPWDHAQDVANQFWTLTANQARNKIIASLEQVATLDEMARQKGIPVAEPWQGIGGYGGQVLILGPSREYYSSLLPKFRDMPGFVESYSPIGTAGSMLSELLKKAASETMDMLTETLRDPTEADTSAENRSSVITLLRLDGRKILLTGDAGADSLMLAADYAAASGISLLDLSMFDIPHHASKHNLGPTVLGRIYGQTAAISAGKDALKHPSQKVINALHRRGMKPVTTEGSYLLHHHESPDRGWGPADIRPFKSDVGDD